MGAFPTLGRVARLTDVEDKSSSVIQHKINARLSRSIHWQPIEQCRTQAEAEGIYSVWIAMRWCKVKLCEI